jgi:hypothetical protein
MAEAFAMLMTIALWILLAFLVAVSLGNGRAPGWAKIALILLVPASGAAALGALKLLSSHATTVVKWPIVIPALAPLCLIGYSLWTAVPAINAAVSSSAAHLGFLGGLAVLSILPLGPLAVASREGTERRAAVQAAYEKEADGKRLERVEKFERVPADAPLWDWLEFVDSSGGLTDRALEAIRRSPRRQADAEVMAARGYGLLTELLPRLDVTPSPAICAGVAKTLRNQADHLPSLDTGPLAYSFFAERIERYLPTIEWLRSGGCDLTAVIDQLSAGALKFQGSPARQAFLARIARSKGAR